MSSADLSPRKAPRQQRSAQMVDRILEAAKLVFDDVGYAGATTNEIALEAKVSIGSLYQYFPNKDALLVEIAHRHTTSTLAAFDALIGSLGSSADLDQVIGDVIDLLVAQHEHDRLHLLIAHEAPRTPELEQELLRVRQHMIDVAEGLLIQQIVDPAERSVAAQLMVVVIDAALHDVILRQPEGPLRIAAIEIAKSTVVGIAGGFHRQEF